VQGGDPRHLADDRLGELLDAVRDPRISNREVVARFRLDRGDGVVSFIRGRSRRAKTCRAED